MIPYSRQSIAQEDIDHVLAVLQSDFLTQGPWVPGFESILADYCDCPHAVAVNSGTSALHIACLALGLQPGDALWTTPMTFVASANCARYCGANVDFVDVNAETGNMDLELLEHKLVRTRYSGTLPKIVVPVHFAGHPCDMKTLFRLGEEYGFKIIEDASHALGADCEGTKVGDARHAHITVLSFHPVKMITTAEGGAAMTRHEELAQKMRMLRTHGITKDAELLTNPDEGAWYYEQQMLGYNYRLTDLQAALGVAQMGRLNSFLEKRRLLAKRYREKLSGLPLALPTDNDQASWHLYRIGLSMCGKSRKDTYDHLREKGYGVQVHYYPVHLQPYYRALGFKPGQFPEAEGFYEDGLSIPLYPDLTFEEQDAFIAALTEWVEG